MRRFVAITKLSSNEIIVENNEIKQYVLDKIFNTKIDVKGKYKKPKDFLKIILQDQTIWYDQRYNDVYNKKVVEKIYLYKLSLAQFYINKNSFVSNDTISINKEI